MMDKSWISLGTAHLIFHFVIQSCGVVAAINRSALSHKWFQIRFHEPTFGRSQQVDKKDAGLARVSTHIHLHKDVRVKQGDLIKWRASHSRPPPESTAAVEYQMALLRLHFHHLTKMIQFDIFFLIWKTTYFWPTILGQMKRNLTSATIQSLRPTSWFHSSSPSTVIVHFWIWFRGSLNHYFALLASVTYADLAARAGQMCLSLGYIELYLYISDSYTYR